jgi:4-diphosphocytidyl-2-C-methyl-D-erythritol kinase
MTSIELTAPAKVNLFLKVLGKRKDSYHNILTLFDRITLADKIRISKTPEGIIVTSDKEITKNPKDNLVYKAAELILKRKKISSGVKIHIKKNIPIAAGLGGGSSDAASVLIGINKLFKLGISTKELMQMGSKLGADVPFFILNTPFAIGSGIGDRLKSVKSKARYWHLLINPGFPVSTKEVYESLDFALTSDFHGVKILSALEEPMDFGTVETMLYNDLQRAVVAKKVIIGNIISRLAALLGKKAIVSGSGPSVFCLYRTRKEALGARKKFLSSAAAREIENWQAFVARTY